MNHSDPATAPDDPVYTIGAFSIHSCRDLEENFSGEDVQGTEFNLRPCWDVGLRVGFVANGCSSGKTHLGVAAAMSQQLSEIAQNTNLERFLPLGLLASHLAFCPVCSPKIWLESWKSHHFACDYTCA